MAYYHSYYGRKKKKSGFQKFIFRLLLFLIVLALGAAYLLYEIMYTPNVWTKDGKPESIYVPTGAHFSDLENMLFSKGLIIHRSNFEWLAKKKNLSKLVKPGRYLISNGLNNNELIDMLRAGKQTPVQVTFNNVRDIYQLAGKVGRQIEADSASLIGLLSDSAYLAGMGKTTQTVSTIFIPNTYEFYWNSTANEFISRMFQESIKFWNKQRKEKAAEIGLSPQQVMILASIVEKETNKKDEKPKIASVYINRLQHGWRLQADPTVIYALGNYNIKRVLNIQKKVDSPYNTYRHRGLPPGPICFPSISSIDAVLNYDKSNFLYFCAKADFSGYHVFARTNRQQQVNADKYQEALDKLKIYR